MTQDNNVSSVRLILEAVTALVIFFVAGIVVVTGTYLAIEGYSQESIQAISTPEGTEKIKYFALLTAPIAMLLTIFMVYFMQKLRGEGFKELGLKKPDNLGRTILYGIGIGVAVYAVAYAVQTILANFGHEPDLGDFTIIQGDFALYLFVMTGVSWLSAALGEEILFRGFIMNNLARAFGGGNTAMIGAVILQAMIFGALHLNQDVAGAAAIFAMALVFGFAYMKFRNLWPLIIGHGLLDNFSFTLLYLELAT